MFLIKSLLSTWIEIGADDDSERTQVQLKPFEEITRQKLSKKPQVQLKFPKTDSSLPRVQNYIHLTSVLSIEKEDGESLPD